MLEWKPGEAGGCAVLPRAHGVATVGTEAHPCPQRAGERAGTLLPWLRLPHPGEGFAGPWLLLCSIPSRVGDGAREERESPACSAEWKACRRGSGAVCSLPPGFRSQHPPRGPFLSRNGPWRVLQTWAGSLGSKERPWHLLTQTKALTLSASWRPPSLLPFPPSLPLSGRAAGYRVPLSVHSGGEAGLTLPVASGAHPPGPE